MTFGSLGKLFEPGSFLLRQGEIGDSMFVIEEGEVEILVQRDGELHRMRVAGRGEVIGEMALFVKSPRSASVRALGPVRALTLDKRAFMKRVHEDPSLAYHILQVMSRRVKELSDELARLKGIAAHGV